VFIDVGRPKIRDELYDWNEQDKQSSFKSGAVKQAPEQRAIFTFLAAFPRFEKDIKNIVPDECNF
jgi:hypothetical protein